MRSKVLLVSALLGVSCTGVAPSENGLACKSSAECDPGDSCAAGQCNSVSQRALTVTTGVISASPTSQTLQASAGQAPSPASVVLTNLVTNSNHNLVLSCDPGATPTPPTLTVGPSASATVSIAVAAVTVAGTATYSCNVESTTGKTLWATFTVSVTTGSASTGFGISLSPGTQAVQAGGSATYTIQTTATGAAQTIALSASGLPAGVTAAFAPTSVTAGAGATLTLSASSTAAAGTTSFSVTGTAGAVSHSVAAGIQVVGAAAVGANGGNVDHLYFAVVGDTRPGTMNDTANYPTAVITQIFQEVQALSPAVEFMVSTGDYMYASGANAQPQMNLYVQARKAYAGTLFAAMGNHECDGFTADNCTVGQTTNNTAFMSALVTPLGKTLPYYSVPINALDGTWTSKVVVISCNTWNATQKSWLTTTLGQPTTYTLLVRHEPSDATTGPCVADVEALMKQFPYDLSIVGHTHLFAVRTKEIVVGTGGAPLANTTNVFGFATIEKVAGGWQVKDYDSATALPKSTTLVP